MKGTPLLVFAVVGIAGASAVGLAVYAAAQLSPLSFWPDTEIACVENHNPSGLHPQSHLTIIIDGETQTIPANIGAYQLCLAEIYTSDTSGVIHMESTEAGKTFTVQDFYNVWGTAMDVENYSRSATVNGEPTPDIASYVMQDGDAIVITYTSLIKQVTDDVESSRPDLNVDLNENNENEGLNFPALSDTVRAE